MSNWSIDFAPMIPPPLFWAGVVLAVVLVALLLLRRSPGAAVRALALGLVVAALANPTLKEEERENLGNVAIVVLDESTSQSLATRPVQTEEIRKDLEAKLGKIPGLEVKWVRAAKPDDTRGGTNLFADLNQALATTPPDRLAGVIMVTDGQVHDVPKSAAALGFDAPVHALLTGRPDEFDRRIEILTAPKFGIVGQSRPVEVAVREVGRGPANAGQMQLRIRRDGRPDELRRVELNRKVTIEMPFPHPGQNILEIELPAVPGELTPANNRVVVTAEGVRENLRVLLVSGEPHAGERTWRNLLKSDAAVDLVHFTILRPPEKQDGTPINQLSLIAFPTRELFQVKIREFDLIIFDRYQHRNILLTTYYDNIAQYVREHGGALLVAAGDDYAGPMSLIRTPLAPVLPAAPTGRLYEMPFKAKLTEQGQKHPVTRDLPGAKGETPSWGRWYRQVDVGTPTGQTVLSGAEDKPLLVLDRKGKGRVALLTSDHAWLWARGHDGGGPHTDLLRRLSHWLMKEPDLEEERLIASAKGLKLTLERRTMEKDIKPVAISAPGGGSSEVTLEAAGPGVFRSTIDVKEPGLYKMTTASAAGNLSAVALAGVEDPREMSEVTATDARLKPLVEGTGGGVFWTRGGGLFGSVSDAVDVPRITMMSGARVLAGSGWMGLKDREAFVTRGIKLTPMFTGLLALAALLFFITLAWWREGK
jgi:hypothetical protein